ncbi:MAG: hypothetical protein AAGD22_07900 [Verrucomicrobiota bacterium]
MKKTVLVLGFLGALGLSVFVSGCAMSDPENWERTGRGLAPHPDDDPTERRTR